MFIAALVATAQQFDMQPGAEITQINPAPVIRVHADRDAAVYDTIDASDTAKDLVFHVKIRGSCPETYRLAGVTASIHNSKLKQRREVKIGFNPEHRSIGPDHGARWDFTLLNFPFLQPETSPATSCNQELEHRVARGDSKTDLLRKGFEVNVPAAYRAFLNVTCHKQKVGFYEDRAAQWDDVNLDWSFLIPAFTGTSALQIMHLDRSGSDLQGGHHAFARAPHTRPHASPSPAGARHGAADLPSGASLRPPGREGGRAALRGLPQIQLETVGQERRRSAA